MARPKGHKKSCKCAVCKNIGKRKSSRKRRRK
jgi:hypothetical protein